MDFYVVLEHPGYRVGHRRRCKSGVGIQHRVTKEDAMKWFQVKYEVCFPEQGIQYWGFLDKSTLVHSPCRCGILTKHANYIHQHT
ncbi:60S ribosomal protein L11 [Sesamum angolense]|uniref:60S ribosomal protein L11 n=1 Tax=Sesamum angolense TaxID=2727404 RepID=A0AAE2BY32_9LAMI|nr:60S ribosomal protein L11 [Sesamum angolense]